MAAFFNCFTTNKIIMDKITITSGIPMATRKDRTEHADHLFLRQHHQMVNL